MKQSSERKQERKKAFIKELKNLIPPLIVVALIVAGAIFVTLISNDEEPEEVVKVNGYEGGKDIIKLENDQLLFELDPTSTHFTVTNKSTGMQWFSNPSGIDEDPLALGSEKERLNSTLLLSYSTLQGLDTNYDNYKYSIQNGIYDIEADKDKIKVHYSIGQTEKVYVIPFCLPEAEFNDFLSRMSQNNANGVKDYYKKYDLEHLGAKDNREELIAKYPIIEQGPIWVLRDNVKDNLKVKFEQYFADAGYTYEQYLEEKALYAGESVNEKPVFNVNIVYSLNGSDLCVEVPMGEIEYKSNYPLTTLRVLPYFGCGGTDENGYMLVPEGGGSIINFNNGKKNQNEYYADVYGWDMALGRDSLVHETRVSYGVFGIAKQNNSMLCILEDGAGYASIRADISGKNNSFNFCYADFTILHREIVDVASRAAGTMYMYQSEIPDESLKLRYRFVGSDKIADMANAYHDYLADSLEGDFSLNTAQTSVPVAVELLMAVDKVEQVAGVPKSMPLALTTYSEAEKLLKDIRSIGIPGLSVKLSGWMNGGVNQKILTRVKLVRRLGSKKDFNSLLSYASSENIPLYLDGVTQYEHDSNIFNGFFMYTDAACFANKKRALLSEYNTIYFGPKEKDQYYLLKPALAVKMMQNLADYASSHKAYGVSFRDAGYQLSSDYKRKSLVTREESLSMQLEEMKKIKDSGLGIMTNVGNIYSLGLTDIVTNVDLSGYDYTILDGDVPFLFLAIHGFTNYTGEPLNNTSDVELMLLKSVECGAGLSFTFMDEDSQTLQNTNYSRYFGTGYDLWKDRFVDIYERYEKELGHTFCQRMTYYEKPVDTVTVVGYEDGTRVYVNYSFNDYTTADGKTVKARDYLVVR